MTAEQIFEEVEKVEGLCYDVVIHRSGCQVYDMYKPEPGTRGRMIIDADFTRSMFENANQALTGLYDELFAKHQADGTLEVRREMVKRRIW